MCMCGPLEPVGISMLSQAVIMLTAMLCCLQGAARAVEDDNKPEVEGVQLNVSTACCVHLALLPRWWAACAHWGLSAGPVHFRMASWRPCVES